MALYVKDAGGSWKDLKSLHIKDNDEWKKVKKLFIKNNGEWKRVIPPTGSKTFLDPGYWQTFEVPQMVDVIYITAIGGGGGAGNVNDGGHNDDYGAGGCGASGQWVKKFPIKVTPKQIISVYVGAGGGNGAAGWGQPNVGGTGGNTIITGDFGTYTLYGGAGGRGGEGWQGIRYFGGLANPTTWTDYTGKVHNVGSDGQTDPVVPRRNGGKGFLTVDGVLGDGQQQTSYGRSGGPYYSDMDATEFGGGGAGILYSYIRQDKGAAPGWGGKGKSGMVTIDW